MSHLVAESLIAGRSVQQLVGASLLFVDDGEARRVEVLPAAPLAGVRLGVAHARLQVLRLAVGDALAALALAPLVALCLVGHGARGRARSLVARAHGLEKQPDN